MPTQRGITLRKSEEQPNHPYITPQDVWGSAISYALYTFFYMFGYGYYQDYLRGINQKMDRINTSYLSFNNTNTFSGWEHYSIYL
jgi:hypothetical protein